MYFVSCNSFMICSNVNEACVSGEPCSIKSTGDNGQFAEMMEDGKYSVDHLQSFDLCEGTASDVGGLTEDLEKKGKQSLELDSSKLENGETSKNDSD